MPQIVTFLTFTFSGRFSI